MENVSECKCVECPQAQAVVIMLQHMKPQHPPVRVQCCRGKLAVLWSLATVNLGDNVMFIVNGSLHLTLYYVCRELCMVKI